MDKPLNHGIDPEDLEGFGEGEEEEDEEEFDEEEFEEEL